MCFNKLCYSKFYILGDEIMVLNKEDMERITCSESFPVEKVELSIGSYYAKKCSDERLFMEYLGKRVFDMVGIKSADCQYIHEKACLLSENLNSDSNFYTAYDLSIMNADTLLQINNGLDNFELATDFDVKKAKLQIEIMHFIDILFSNIHRNISDFGFYLLEDKKVLLAVLNNGDFLQNFNTATRPVSFNDEDIYSLKFSNISKRNEAGFFFDNMSKEMKDLSTKYLELFIPNNIETMITSIEMELQMECPSKESRLKEYAANYCVLCGLLRKAKRFGYGRTMKRDKQ